LKCAAGSGRYRDGAYLDLCKKGAACSLGHIALCRLGAPSFHPGVSRKKGSTAGTRLTLKKPRLSRVFEASHRLPRTGDLRKAENDPHAQGGSSKVCGSNNTLVVLANEFANLSAIFLNLIAAGLFQWPKSSPSGKLSSSVRSFTRKE
jgi:hypothetical protein